MTFGLRLTCVLISQNDLSHKFQNSSLSGGLPGGSMLCFIGQQHDCIDTHFWKGGKKTVNFFGGQKLEVCYHASYLYINRVCRFVRFSWKLPWMFLRYYHTEVHKAWMKFEIFLSQFIWVWHQGKSNLTIYFLRNQWEYWNCLTLFVIAHYLLSDTVQFVSRSGVTFQEAGNSVKQTPSMLHLNAYMSLSKQTKTVKSFVISMVCTL